MQAPHSIVEAAEAMARGGLTPLELVEGCLSWIRRFEPHTAAWVSVDAEGAIRAAERLTRERATRNADDPLYGIPIGIKDIVDVAGWPTRAGSRLTSETPAGEDATVVARLRAAGAIILGKTVTTEFACFDPPPTKNPWNSACTPGGSSSGSAAAVALGMCPGAIASQTGGSITRPASYCGVAGIKPTFGRVSRAGVIPVSYHLDHVGTIGRTAADCAILLRAIAGHDERDSATNPRLMDPTTHPWPGDDMPDDLRGIVLVDAPRLGVVRPYFFETAEEETARLVEEAIRQLAEQGARVVELSLPEGFEDVHTMHRQIMTREGAGFHRDSFGAPRDGYGPKMTQFIEEGLAVTEEQYVQAMRHQVTFRYEAVDRWLGDIDAAVMPSTPGPAPADLTTTGDPRFNSPWSYAGAPTVSIPCALTKAGLPVSVQFIGRAWTDWRLGSVAVWCERRIGFRARPPSLAEAGQEVGHFGGRV
jgi:aspartyl-tRNA(Asn)/glutamyl-tRNA(Gln) amidotransferase subunit A